MLEKESIEQTNYNQINYLEVMEVWEFYGTKILIHL